ERGRYDIELQSRQARPRFHRHPVDENPFNLAVGSVLEAQVLPKKSGPSALTNRGGKHPKFQQAETPYAKDEIDSGHVGPRDFQAGVVFINLVANVVARLAGRAK